MVSLIIKLKNHEGFSVSCVPLYFKTTVLPYYNDNSKKGIKMATSGQYKSGLNYIFYTERGTPPYLSQKKNCNPYTCLVYKIKNT